MALSGSVTTTKYDSRYYQLDWSATQSVANNQSTISWTLYAKGKGSSWVAERTLVVEIAGTKVVNKTDRVARYDGVVSSGNLTVSHDSAGNKSFSVSIQAAVYASSVNVTGSNSFTLNQIARAATLTSAPDFTDEATPIIKYTNPAGNNVTKLEACISFTGAKDDITYRNVNKTGTLEYKFVFTEAERKALWSRVTKGSSNTVIFYLKTTIGSNVFYSTLEKTLYLVNHEPSVNGTAVDTGANSTRLTGDPTKMIKGFNQIKYTTGAAAYKGATVSSSYCYNNGTKYSGASGTIQNATNGTFMFGATDNRGNTTDYARQVDLTVINYIPLTCNLETDITLQSNDSTKVDIEFTITGDYFNDTFGAVRNSLALAYTLEYGSGGASYVPIELPADAINGNQYSVTVQLKDLDYQDSYTIKAEAWDEVQRAKDVAASSVSKVLKATPVFEWGKDDFAFNVPVAINGDLVVSGKVLSADGEENCPTIDYPVEQGTKNGWGYRKWNSGFAECWYSASVSGVDVGEFNLNGFYYSGSKGVNFPFTFTSVEYINATGGSTGNMNIVRPFNNTNSSMTYIVIGMSDVSSATVRINLEAKGRWK